jgi:hypothetical protein
MVPARPSKSEDPAWPAREASGQADPYVSWRFVGNAFAAVILAASLFELWRNFVQPGDRDFLAVWAAARLTLAGHSWAAYDSPVLHAVEAAAATFSSAGAELPFPYPPAYLLLVLPLGLVAFPVAMAAWSLVTFAFYLFGARRLMPRSGWLAAAFPAVYANAAIGQNGFLTAGIFMAGLALLTSSPLAAGLVLGCLVIKPQLALLLPIALVAGRQWRAVLGAAASASGIMLLGLVLFGPATTIAWLGEAPLIIKVTGDGLMGWSKLASIYAAAREIGIEEGPAILVHALAALAGAALVWRSWREDGEAGAKIAILAAASMLISPYLFYYDGLFLVPAFFYLADKKERAAILLALWSLPLLVIGQIGGGELLNLNPFGPILLTALVLRRSNAAKSRSDCANLTFGQPFGVRLSQRV